MIPDTPASRNQLIGRCQAGLHMVAPLAALWVSPGNLAAMFRGASEQSEDVNEVMKQMSKMFWYKPLACQSADYRSNRNQN